MELIDNSYNTQCNVCGRVTSKDRNISLDEKNIKELKLGYRNQCQCISLCRTCRENLRDLLIKDLSKSQK